MQLDATRISSCEWHIPRSPACCLGILEHVMDNHLNEVRLLVEKVAAKTFVEGRERNPPPQDWRTKGFVEDDALRGILRDVGRAVVKALDWEYEVVKRVDADEPLIGGIIGTYRGIAKRAAWALATENEQQRQWVEDVFSFYLSEKDFNFMSWVDTDDEACLEEIGRLAFRSPEIFTT